MAQPTQTDPYAKYGGSLAPPPQPGGSLEQPIASVRTADNSNVGDSFQMDGQDVYVSGVDSKGRKTLSPGKPPQQSGDPYSKYGGRVASVDPYAHYSDEVISKPSAPPMTRQQADEYLQTLAAGGTKPVQLPKPPSFAQTALVDPESPVFGEPIKAAVHPDTRGGGNLVDVRDVAATRQQRQYEAQHPDEMAQVAHSQAMDTSLPLAERLANRAGLEARKRTELGQAVSNVNDQWKQFAGSKGADAGEAFAQFMARNFQTENPQATPGEIGVARSIGKNVASTAADSTTYGAMLVGGVGGKVGQIALSSLFAAGAAKGSYDAAGQLGSIWDRDDISKQQKAEMASDLFLNTAMAGMAGKHAVKVSFMSGADPLLSQVPTEYRTAVKGRINSILNKTGGVLSRAASTAGDVMAEVGNSDRENVPTQGATALRRAIPNVPAASAETALPLIRAAANDAGFKTVTASDLLDSPPDKDGSTSLGLIGQAKNEVLAQAHAAAGPGRTIADMTPQEMEPYQRMFNALDDVHDHIQQAQDEETAELKKAADRGKIPATKAAALVRMGMGAGKVAVSASAGPALGRMSRVLLHAYGIPSGFNDLVTGVKGLIGAGGKLSPTLDENLNAALGRTQPADTGTFGANPDTRTAATPYQGDTTVQHDSLIFPPETPHGDATMLRDEPNPRFQLSSATTNPVPQGRRIAPIAGRPPVGADNGVGSFTSVPRGVTPELEPRQRSLAEILSGRQEATPQPAVSREMPAPNPRDVIVPRGQHPESIVERALTHLSLSALREAARAGDIDYSPSDTHQDLIGKIMDAYAGQDEHLENLAETLQGRRGAIPAGPREKAPVQDDDLTDVMSRSVEQANARKAGKPAADGGQQPQRSFMDVMRGTGERRQPGNADIRSRFNDMTEAEKTQALMEAHQRERTSKLTGLPNYTAFNESANEIDDTHPHVGYADVDDFKKVNSVLGHEGADAVLSEIGNLFAHAQAEENGAVHSFHRSGDEFLFRASDPEAITRVVDRVNNQLAKTKFTFTDSAGKEVEQKGIGLSHGTGSDEHSAESAADASKQLRTEQGKRTGSRDQTEVHSVGTSSPTGANAQVNNISQRASVPDTDSRTAQAQQELLAHGMISNGPGSSPDNPISPHDLRPGQAAYVKVQELIPQPKKYQYKGNTDAAGVVAGQITGTRYNHDLANALSYFIDPEDNVSSPVNGHNRRNLAVRSGETGVLARRLDAPDVATARKIGALQNISEGRGTALDAANFFREENITPDDLRNRGVAISEGIAQQGLALARLDPMLFEKVRSGQWTESRGATIGAVTDDPAQQEAIAKLIQKAENKGKSLTNGQVESLARQVIRASKRVEEGQDLFGMFSREHSTAIERAELDDHIQRQIAGDKRIFGSVASESKAKSLGQVEGQQIKSGENARISQRAAQELELYRKLSDKAGEINDILDNGAKELANANDKPAVVKAKYANKVRQVLRQYIPEGDHPSGSSSASTAGKGPQAKATSGLKLRTEDNGGDQFQAALRRRRNENNPFDA